MKRPKCCSLCVNSILAVNVILALCTPPATGTATADIYRYQDSSGIVYYSNIPDSSQYRLFRSSAAKTQDLKSEFEGRCLRQENTLLAVIDRLFAGIRKMSVISKPSERAKLHRAYDHQTVPAFDNGIHIVQALIRNLTRQTAPDNVPPKTKFGDKKKKEKSAEVPPENRIEIFIARASEKYKVPASLLKALIKVESNFDHMVVSHMGAVGLMQIMPGNFSSLNIDDPFDPWQNIAGGTQYLKRMLDRFDGNISLALAAYNAGPYAVERHRGIPPYEETILFVRRVLQYFKAYQKGYRPVTG